METWCLTFDEWDEDDELLRESLCTLGNGYFATRGAAEETVASPSNYPGTYLSGGYDRLFTTVAGREIRNEDLVNWPNWTCLTFRIGDGEWFDLSQVEVLSFEQILDFEKGELRRKVCFKDREGRESELITSRFVSMANQHVAGINWSLRSLNWKGPLTVKSFIDGSVRNAGVKRYRDLSSKHLRVRNRMALNEGIFLECSTVNSEIVMAMAARSRAFLQTGPITKGLVYWESEESVGETLELQFSEQDELRVEKIVTIFTSRDRAISNPAYETQRLLSFSPSYAELFRAHGEQWKRLWDLCDISLDGNPHESKLLRLHIFHLLQTASFKSIDLDVGIPSRGLHGEAYRGHIFWDEMFILPFLNLRIPEISRSLLMYRYRRLNEARLNARSEGFAGATYPWQSGSNGEEESQVIHLNPNSGRWIPDNTYKQRHINATIVYNVWKYYQVTHDREFLFFFGIEMLLEISRFWASLMTFNESRGRYDIKGVVGPDEFHTKYPGRDELGIDNNSYTNFMVSWCLRTTNKLFYTLARERREELLSILRLDESELGRWEEMSRKIFIPFQEGGIIGQFEGFEELKDLDWAHYRQKYGNIQRIDRILEAEGDDPNCYKLNKQADVVMLFYLFSPQELQEGFNWLGYEFEPEKCIPKNIEYHISLSSNGSSLSRIVHSWVLARYDYSAAWLWFQRALESDISDIQGGTTAEGIHLGAMAGTVDLVQRCFTGLDVREDVLLVDPAIPMEVSQLSCSIRFRGQTLLLRFEEEKFFIKVQRSSAPMVKVGSAGRVYELRQGEEIALETSVRSEGRELVRSIFL